MTNNLLIEKVKRTLQCAGFRQSSHGVRNTGDYILHEWHGGALVNFTRHPEGAPRRALIALRWAGFKIDSTALLGIVTVEPARVGQ